MIAWGVDPALRRLSLAVVTDVRGTSADVYTGEGAAKGVPLASALCTLQALALELANKALKHGQPDIIVVEQPSGKFKNLPLYYAAGVVQQALASLGVGFVTTLPPPSWKAASGIGGGANKERIMEWARAELGYTGDIQDEADALGIATAASKLTTITEAQVA